MQQQKADTKAKQSTFVCPLFCEQNTVMCWRVSDQQLLARMIWTLEYILVPCLHRRGMENPEALSSVYSKFNFNDFLWRSII